VVEEAADRLSFRSFLGIGTGDRVPDDTSLVRFRKRLVEADLLDALYSEVIIQMNEQGLGIAPGSMQIVDATLIKAAPAPAPPSKDTPEDERTDPDADFTVKNGKPHYGYKLHLAQDRETGLVTGHATSQASVHDSQVFEGLITDSQPAQIIDRPSQVRDIFWSNYGPRAWTNPLGPPVSPTIR
jgi:IS5 family transposase